MKLHIGGNTKHSDWKILDIAPRPEVDFVADAKDLGQFGDETVEAIYASHVLEHFHYHLDNELYQVLCEWHRVLEVGAKLYVSVPDLKKLCEIYLYPDLIPQERLVVMSMIYGGQVNEHDRHFVGFDLETLGQFLEKAGFMQYEQVEGFDLFEDTSQMRIRGELISLNLVALKC